MGTILLTGLLMLLVVVLLVALVWSVARLMNGARTRADDTTREQGQQGFLRSSVLHIMLRAGR
jgi:uncharacterized membrane protein